MNSQINLSNKKKIFTISSILKSSNDKKNCSSRSNTQEMPQYNNHSKNKSSSCKYRKNINNNSSLYNNKKEDLPKKYTGITNISTKINSDTNSKTNMAKKENKNLNVYQYKELINIKDKKIAELEKLITIYRDKLKNQIRVFNINTSINSFNLSKTRSSTNITERNIYKIRSLSNSQAKIKTSYPPTKNIYGNNKIVNNKMNYNKNTSKKRPKTNNYKKPKMNNYFFGNKNIDNKIHINNFKRNETTSKQKYKNKNNDYNSKYKRARSSNIEKNRKNNNLAKSCTNNNTNNTNKDENLLTIEETKNLCDNMMEKMKNVLELVKMATTGD